MPRQIIFDWPDIRRFKHGRAIDNDLIDQTRSKITDRPAIHLCFAAKVLIHLPDQFHSFFLGIAADQRVGNCCRKPGQLDIGRLESAIHQRFDMGFLYCAACPDQNPALRIKHFCGRNHFRAQKVN